MARRKANTLKTVDTIVHATGDKAEIHLNTETGEFSCTNRFIGEAITGSQLNHVRELVKERLKTLPGLTWEPVIAVDYYKDKLTYGNAYTKHASAALKISRYWVARRKHDCALRCWIWEDTEEYYVMKRDERDIPLRSEKAWRPVDRLARSDEQHDLAGDWTLPYRPARQNRLHGEGQTVYFAYSEPLWLALNRVLEIIETAQKQLLAIMSADQVDSLLTAWITSTPLLQAGKD